MISGSHETVKKGLATTMEASDLCPNKSTYEKLDHAYSNKPNTDLIKLVVQVNFINAYHIYLACDNVIDVNRRE